jgi:hypothetical protein
MIARHILLAGLAVALAGCGGGSIQKDASAPQQRLVRVDWYGYQCFRIKSSLGISIVTNPFSPGSTEFSQPKNLSPEIVLITTENDNANYVDMVESTPQIIRSSVGIGECNAGGVRFLGVPVFKTPNNQDISGMNVVFRWSMDGLKFCFLGELDRLPPQSDLDHIGNVDVLFIPVSGTQLAGAQRQQIIQQLHPRIVVPMGSLSDMSRFASGYSSVYHLNGPAALLSRDALPAAQTVLLFRAP